MTSIELAPDPIPVLTVGARTHSVADWDSPVHGIYVTDDRWCRANSPDTTYFRCSRPAGHPTHWRHVAANRDSIVAVWGGGLVPDPFAGITVDELAGHRTNWDHPEYGLRGPDVDMWCRSEHVRSGRICTRPSGHPGDHVCTRQGHPYRVLRVWRNENAPTLPTEPPEPVDPEDGSPVDSEDRVFTQAPEVATVVKLRDRRNRLYVLGQRRHTPEVEVLDLLRDELRAIPWERCVQIDDPLSPDELRQVTRYYARHRDQVRQVAVREYRGGRWCMDGLNENLTSMGMEQHEPVLNGKIQVLVPFVCPNIHERQSSIEAAVQRALLNPEVSAAMRVALPPVDGIELEPERLTIRAIDFQRS